MVDLKDCTFIIPFKNDNQDRIANLNTILNFLNTFFKTNVIVVEQDDKKTPFKLYDNLNFSHILYKNSGVFHKTKLYNIGIVNTKTKITVPYDTDVLFTVQQFIDSRDAINQGIDYVYPYSKPLVKINSSAGEYKNRLLNDFNFEDYMKFVKRSDDEFKKIYPRGFIRSIPHGGAVFINTEKYIQMGMENELFYGYSPEDQERKHRFLMLEYKTKSIDGYLFHIDHKVDHNRRSPKQLNLLLNNIKKMSKDELKAYYKKLDYFKNNQKFIESKK